MSWQATQAVLTHSQATGTERLVLFVLATYADAETGEAWPSVAAIAQGAALKERQTQALLRRLEQSGEVTAEVGRGRKNTTVYTLTCLKKVQNSAPISAEKVQDPAPIPAKEKVQDRVEKVQDSAEKVQSSVEKVQSSAPEPKNHHRTIKNQKEEARQITAPPSAASPKTVRPKPEPKNPTPFQEMFAAVAETCYGGHENLTSEASARIGRAAKSLTAAGYAPGDVPQVAAWISRNEAWRKGPIAPQTLSERAPAWRQGVKVAGTSLPKPNELDDQDWDAVAAEVDARNSGFLGAAGWVN